MTGKIIEIKGEPYVYNIEVHLAKLLAAQNAKFETRTPREKFFRKEQITETQQGTPESKLETEIEPAKKKVSGRKRVTVVSKKETGQLLTRNFERRPNGDNTNHIIAPMGYTFGHLKSGVVRAARAQLLNKYTKIPALELLWFEPEFVDLGPDENVTFTDVLEKRAHDARELCLYETITDRVAKAQLKVSKTCPLTGEEIASILIGLRDLDGFGPSKRGRISSITISAVNVSD